MLKSLELVGFKSFADKTTFEFGEGVTAIVGPNGSGKSNIVDAVRWILGEQSAKSLRGGEMADVIFNGSTSRRSLGMAEVTLTFDNSKKALAIATDEVHISRRVYRSGEGEYLINQQICRLKDIKEMLLGSGAGNDAYCIIEQGRVDVLLQASAYDRRAIFEEAAGISRFKAKKIEAVRKLERVDQNLQRLKDIIDEVEKQLRSIKLQASKAQRYQEYSTRLKELRVALGLREYQQFSEQLRVEDEIVEQLKAALTEKAARASAWEAEMQGLEAILAKTEDSLGEQETHLAHAREQITAADTTLGHEWSLAESLDTEMVRTRTRSVELTNRVAQLAATADCARAAFNLAQSQTSEQHAKVRGLQEASQAAVEAITSLRSGLNADKAEHLEQMRLAARLQNDAVSYKAQLDNLLRERDRLRLKTSQATESLASLDVELQELTAADGTLQNRLQTSRQALADLRQERERLQKLRDETGDIVSRLRQEHSGAASRIEVLEGLERSQEGLGTGVREVLEHLRAAGQTPWRTVLGMVADFLTVQREYAHLIDLALGEWSQRFVVRDLGMLSEALAQRPRPFSGRVSFLPIANEASQVAQGEATGEGVASPRRSNRLLEVSLHGRVRMPVSPGGVPAHSGLVASAETLVSCDNPELIDLPSQLLGQTLVVRNLDTARAIAAHTSGYRFVTLQGELLEPDGTLTVGAYHGETGILSRKSELRELRLQLSALQQRIADTEQDLADLREQLAGLESREATGQQEIEVLAEQAADLRARVERHRDKRLGLDEEVTLSRDEIRRIAREIQTLETSWQDSQSQAGDAEAAVHALQQRNERTELEIRQRELERHQCQQEATAGAVALAKAEERLEGLRVEHERAAADCEQRREEAALADQALLDCKAKLEYSRLTMLNASSALAHWYRHKETAEGQVRELNQSRQDHRQERKRLATSAQAVRNDWRTQQEQVHSRELQVNDIRHRRDSLADRLREDYQVELAELAQQAATACVEATAAAPQAAETDEEIAELRRKLGKLGSVNLEALEELRELEERSATQHRQFDDLTAAKCSLGEIIQKINQDSGRLFTDMFASIRGHFQELFRKLFGGGMADIILENENDILESGIDIIAKPPGKELRGISLMSGGEKTLTAVALLLAVFRSKPSPFCILDEVDAALDEANIGRFTGVLREFLDLSQFIIITHSKKTMACADVLYGITMQESGISKRVSVRFEDWPDNVPGEKRPRSNGRIETAAAAS